MSLVTGYTPALCPRVSRLHKRGVALSLCFHHGSTGGGGGRMRRVGAAEHRQVEGGGAALGRGSGAGELGLTRLLLRPLRQSAVRSYNDPGS